MDEYSEYVEKAKQLLAKRLSQPRKKTSFPRFLEPGDKGFVENRGDYPWSAEAFFAGIPRDVSIDLLGFVIYDRRTSPHLMIFKNQKVVLTHGFKPVLNEAPIPFESIRDAEIYLEKLHLSEDQRSFFEISALAFSPPPGHPRPDTLIFDSKKEIKNY